MRKNIYRKFFTGLLAVPSLFSIFVSSPAQAEWLSALKFILERDGQIVVYGDPHYDVFYRVEGLNYAFAGGGCALNQACQLAVSYGGAVFDGEMNFALKQLCDDESIEFMVCLTYDSQSKRWVRRN